MNNNELSELNSRNPRPSFISDGIANSLMDDIDGSEDRSVSIMNAEEPYAGRFKRDGPTKGLAAQETKAVHCIKIILLIILLLASCGFAVVVYKFTRNEETDTFEGTFVVYSQQIEYAMQSSARTRLEAVGALAFQIQSYAHDNNLTWPFVTVSFFEDRVYSMKTLTDAFGIQIFPIVSHKDRQAWEIYSVANCQWVNESHDSQRTNAGNTDEAYRLNVNETWLNALWGDSYETYHTPDFSSGIGGSIFGTWDPNNETIPGPFIYPDRRVYFPQWQVAPLSLYSQATINQNYAQFDDFENATRISLETGHAVLGIAWIDNETPGYITTMIYPIYREIYTDKNHHGSLDVVAFLGVDIDWKDYLTGIFQDDEAGATVVIENSLDQVFTYKVTGASVTFVGTNDTHDRTYDYMEESFTFGGHLASGRIIKESLYTGALLHPDWVQYTIRIYPSQDLEETFYTAQPVVCTVVVLLVALIASGTFFLYDYLVERRQKVVLRTAERSDALVSSLFPSTVKEQLYQTTGTTGDSSGGNKASKKPSSDKLNNEEKLESDGRSHDCAILEQGQVITSLVSSDDNMIEGAVAGSQRRNHRKLEGPPIAELYEAATVFFADMVGFTAWSSQRSPADVFTLLETCYGAFDVVADRRGVFKVETIGDCYVAVSGIPFRRADHAIIMAKFARDILNAMSQQLGILVPILGSSTASLAMRVGIHSGPVTAGVLRGDRARFQLFGDTVNTAARMESTSLRNRVQLSQATADLLIHEGKAAWITKRSDEVEAKGKGRMQTYWLKCSVPFPVAKPGSITAVSLMTTPSGAK